MLEQLLEAEELRITSPTAATGERRATLWREWQTLEGNLDWVRNHWRTVGHPSPLPPRNQPLRRIRRGGDLSPPVTPPSPTSPLAPFPPFGAPLRRPPPSVHCLN